MERPSSRSAEREVEAGVFLSLRNAWEPAMTNPTLTVAQMSLSEVV